MDLSFRALFAHQNGRSYAITTTFDGEDLVNGGLHQAVDVGNFGMDDPITSPITGRARGLYHYDTAIGIEYELGDGWMLELWHLNATLSTGLAMTPGRSDTGDWVDVTRGQVCGRTGNSGALVNGKPMPAHTHIRLERGGQPHDIAPYLLGRPFTLEDDMLGRRARFLREPFKAELLPGTAIRDDVDDLSKPAVNRSPASGDPWVLTVIATIPDGAEFRASTEWWVYGSNTRGLLAFHSQAATRLPPQVDTAANLAAHRAGFYAGRDAATAAAGKVEPT